MTNWHALEVEAEYRQHDFQRTAERNRILNSMKKKQPMTITITCSFLDNLGKLLVNLGSGLRTRYGSLA
jgi:hypothetical protein